MVFEYTDRVENGKKGVYFTYQTLKVFSSEHDTIHDIEWKPFNPKNLPPTWN